MSDKPEALRLADELEARHQFSLEAGAAADELRRLHEAHDWQYRMAGERLRRVEKLEAQRDALLEALQEYGRHHEECPHRLCTCGFHAAIAKAEAK